MREENRARCRAPCIERRLDTRSFIPGIDYERRGRRVPMPNQVAVRLERTEGQRPDVEPAAPGLRAQTENEVPQPQDPVAFGLSNVKPDPLKLL